MKKCCLIEDNKYYFLPYGGGCEITCHKCGYKLFGRTYNSAKKRWAMKARNISFSYRSRRFFSLFFSVLVLAVLACGVQALPTQAVDVVTPSNDVSLPVAPSHEPTESPVIFVTTAPLNVRSEANADSQILGVLEAGTVVTVFILDIRGDDCYTGEWLAIDKPIAGFVCSLYIEEQ